MLPPSQHPQASPQCACAQPPSQHASGCTPSAQRSPPPSLPKTPPCQPASPMLPPSQHHQASPQCACAQPPSQHASGCTPSAQRSPPPSLPKTPPCQPASPMLPPSQHHQASPQGACAVARSQHASLPAQRSCGALPSAPDSPHLYPHLTPPTTHQGLLPCPSPFLRGMIRGHLRSARWSHPSLCADASGLRPVAETIDH
mmetsp:Transcript_79827/g.146813  ORF Transcript_79827/g.146813 Transcript_79827/m.146813 type:complete len:200 (-) Transcript_79827:2188-2787(-)